MTIFQLTSLIKRQLVFNSSHFFLYFVTTDTNFHCIISIQSKSQHFTIIRRFWLHIFPLNSLIGTFVFVDPRGRYYQLRTTWRFNTYRSCWYRSSSSCWCITIASCQPSKSRKNAHTNHTHKKTHCLHLRLCHTICGRKCFFHHDNRLRFDLIIKHFVRPY